MSSMDVSFNPQGDSFSQENCTFLCLSNCSEYMVMYHKLVCVCCACVCTYISTHMPWCTHAAQRTTLGSCFSSLRWGLWLLLLLNCVHQASWLMSFWLIPLSMTLTLQLQTWKLDYRCKLLPSGFSCNIWGSQGVMLCRNRFSLVSQLPLQVTA